MTNDKTKPRRLARMARRTCAAALLLSGLIPACLNRPLEPIDTRNTYSFQDKLPQSRVDKIDILLAIDDSKSMGDKQEILAVAVPDLVDSLVNPACINPTTGEGTAVGGPLADCPEGTSREFTPVLDIHIGVISTSMGPRGGNDNCSDDGAHLLNRTDAEGGTIPTLDGMGFLAWDPTAPSPAAGSYQAAEQLGGDLAKLVVGVGQGGCGLEAQLESWYRFLVDPSPYEETVLGENGKVTLEGIDQDLLAQRAAFLRKDSLVAIMMLTDENDCSFKPNSFGHYTANYNKITSLEARQECATDPNDPCCLPCGVTAEHCPVDPTCDGSFAEDIKQTNLRCFQQKRRFGADFLYDTQRYIDGLTKQTIKDRNGDTVDNPLLVAADGTRRGDDRVFFAGVVGVPWQLIARDSTDLRKGFKNADELTETKAWTDILGDPANHVAPGSPYMIESAYPRAGLAPLDSATNADAIHGHEFANDFGKNGGDVQYACTFPLKTPLDCTTQDCDCKSSSTRINDPLCQNPDGSYGTTQHRAKAFPGLRHLEVLKGIGDKGIVASICPAQQEFKDAADYGYRPAVEALIDRLKDTLVAPCLPRPLVPDAKNQVSCLLLEGRTTPAGECNCAHAQGRNEIPPEHMQASNDFMLSGEAVAANVNCICEIQQTDNEELAACQNDISEPLELNGENVHGWCYVDEEVAADELVAHCSTDKQTIRFVGEGEPVNNSIVYLSCVEAGDE